MEIKLIGDMRKLKEMKLANEKLSCEFERNNRILRLEIKKETNIKEEVIAYFVTVEKKNIGYIKLYEFYENCSMEFKQKLEDLERRKMDRLIIDLRGNPGGKAEEAFKILSLFLDKKHLLCINLHKNKTTKKYSKGTITKKYPIVLLSDEFTASASEITISCLMEQINATLIGTKTFGKGIGQTSIKTGHYNYNFTSFIWLTSKGKSIHGKGIEPTIKIEQDINYFKKPSFENDKVYKEAIQYLISI